MSSRSWRRRTQVTRRGFVIGAALWLAGCMLGPDYERPATAEGGAWHEPLAGGFTAAPPDREALATWWHQLADPRLDDLVARAVAGNLDVRGAGVCLEECE